MEERELILGNIVLYMREYQRINGITKQCVTNTQYYYDMISGYDWGEKIKARAVIVALFNENDVLIGACTHMALMMGETIIEPSYELYSMPNKKYYDNVGCFLEQISPEHKITHMSSFKETVKHTLNMIKLAEKINNGGFVIVDKEYYKKQADYIEEKIDDMIHNKVYLKTF